LFRPVYYWHLDIFGYFSRLQKMIKMKTKTEPSWIEIFATFVYVVSIYITSILAIIVSYEFIIKILEWTTKTLGT